MIRLTYRIDLQQPILVTSLDGDPNSVVSFNYLPGTVLRGALIAQHRKSGDPFDNQLFIEGGATFFNGYPMNPKNDLRTLPKPASWYGQKNNPDTIYDFALTTHPDKANWEGVEGHFCTVEADTPPLVTVVKPKRYMAIHTARNREYGRARPQTDSRNTTLAGAVYRFEALAKNQSFVAHILCQDEGAAEKLKPLLAGRINIGKATTTHYGRVTLKLCQCSDGQWYETGSAPDWQTEQLTITFLSDAIFRNQWGQFTADAETIQAHLEDTLNCSLTPKTQQQFLKSHLMGGFNRTWGLPLPQVQVVGMGSVLAFDMPQEEGVKERLYTLMNTGIGERTVEGFGRIAINWQGQAQLTLGSVIKGYMPPPPKQESTNVQTHPMLVQMVDRLKQQQLDNRLLAEANTITVECSPRRSQLHRLRQQLQQALTQEPNTGRLALKQYIQTLRSRAVTRQQFAKAQIKQAEQKQPLLDWLTQHIEADKLLWAADLADAVPAIGSVRATFDNPQRIYEANLQFLDTTLARIANTGESHDG